MSPRKATDREILVTRTFDARRELVFEAFSKAEHLAHWWGPNGFTTTTRLFEFKPGGYWRFTMHGPDGRDYPNWIRFKEIAAPNRISYSHGGDSDRVTFETEISFEERDGATTVTLSSLFPSREARDLVVKEYKAIEGAHQTLRRLHEFVASKDAFVLSRLFEAPRELLFDVWTDPAHTKNWLAPKGFTIRHVKADIRPGGMIHYSMTPPGGGTAMWGKAIYREIVRPKRLVYVQSFSDEKGGVTRHPMSETWPLRTLTTIMFEEEGDKTRMILTWVPVDASEVERETFEKGRPSMSQGWGGTMEQLEAYLKQLS